jgi:hypothetical protein
LFAYIFCGSSQSEKERVKPTEMERLIAKGTTPEEKRRTVGQSHTQRDCRQFDMGFSKKSRPNCHNPKSTLGVKVQKRSEAIVKSAAGIILEI